MFITSFTRPRHLSIFWVRPTQYTNLRSQHTSWRSISVLSTYLSLGFPSGLFRSFRFQHQIPVRSSTLPHTCYMPRTSHFYRLDKLKNVWWKLQIINTSLCSSLHFPVTSSFLDPSILLNTLFSNNLSLSPSVNVSDQVSHSYKKTKIKVLCTSIYIF
jgi:hypothetical protein